jgi:hypothetical protein
MCSKKTQFETNWEIEALEMFALLVYNVWNIQIKTGGTCACIANTRQLPKKSFSGAKEQTYKFCRTLELREVSAPLSHDQLRLPHSAPFQNGEK